VSRDAVQGRREARPSEALPAPGRQSLYDRMIALLEALVGRCEEVLRKLKEAGLWKSCAYPIEYEKGPAAELPHVARMMRAGDLLAAEAWVRRRAGADDRDSAVALGRLADSLQQEPLLVSQLVRSLLLSRSGVGDPESMRPVLARVMEMEVASAMAGGFDALGQGDLRDPRVRAMAEHYVETMREASALMTRPWHESRAALEELFRTRIEPSDWRGDASRQLLPAFWRVVDVVARAEAARGPAVDPFSGKPMVSRGGVTYSVGPNGVDDGGDAKLDIVLRRNP